MAAKLLHSLADDNPDLQKQIGCMTGIFQLFDRQSALTGRRLSHRKLPPGDSHGSSERPSFNGYQRSSTSETNSNKNTNEKQRISMESSRTSFSSSCSSMSSLDGYKPTQPEPSSYDLIVFPETPSRNAVLTQPTTSPRLSRQSLDLRDVVKDSMYREARGLSVKTTTKEEALNKDATSSDMRESLKVLAKLSEAPWYYNETRERQPRDGPRLSFESRDTIKSAMKLKELPRLSLDSREKSMWYVNSDLNAQRETLGTHKRPPSVVAKLMGLEALPSASTSQSSLVMPGQKSSRNSVKDPVSPRWKNPDLIMKPISRLPIEPAPWKHVKVSGKKPNPFPTVYSEIEKRLKDLEFNQSGKDLRALKQILEAMQAKGILDTRKEEKDSNFGIGKENGNDSEQRPRMLSQRNQHSGHVSGYDSPIVIMKPAKLVEKSGFPSSSVIPIDRLNLVHKTPSNGNIENRNRSSNTRTMKDQSPRRDSLVNSNARNRATQSSTRPQQSPKESATNSVKSTASVSPRLQQKKLELERKSRPPTPPPDLTKPRRQSNRVSTESSGKIRPKPHKAPHNDDQLSQISNESSHQGDDASQQSDSTVVFDLKADLEISSVGQSSEANDVSMKPNSKPEGDALDTPEHPSPVSVLDASVYRDDKLPTGDGSKNPADNVISDSRKKLQNIENLVKKLRRLNSTHDEASNDYIASLCENTNPDHRYISEILLASGLLLRDLEATISTFQLHPSGHPINPELFLVLEQTKTSTLQSKESSPNQKSLEKIHRKLIFDAVNEVIAKKLALKRNKLAKTSLNAQKLLKEVCSEVEMLRAKKSGCGFGEEEDGLKGILWDDVMNGWKKWTDFNGEKSGIVLDVERSIFKDLVDEIVIGGAAGLKNNKPVRRRQLFAK